MLTGDRGQNRQRGRQAQLLDSVVPPPEGGGGRDGREPSSGSSEHTLAKGGTTQGDDGTTAKCGTGRDILTRASSPRGPPSGSPSVTSTCHSGTWTYGHQEVSRARERVSALPVPTPRGLLLAAQYHPQAPRDQHRPQVSAAPGTGWERPHGTACCWGTWPTRAEGAQSTGSARDPLRLPE